MREFLFCLTTLLFLMWVILLKNQIDSLNRRIAELEAERKRRRSPADDVCIHRDVEVWETHGDSSQKL